MKTSVLVGILVPLSMLSGVALWVIAQSAGWVSPTLPYEIQSEVAYQLPAKKK